MDKTTLESSGAFDLAGKVVDGSISASEGCSRLAEICHRLNDPAELALFSLLAHEQSGHDHIGITAESLDSEVIEACRAFVAHRYQ